MQAEHGWTEQEGSEESTCGSCGSPLGDAEQNCLTCGAYVSSPNVRAAKQKGALQALQQRYLAALRQAKENGLADHQLTAFEACMAQTRAVINMELEDLRYFVVKRDRVYSTYQLCVDGEIRKPSTGRLDRHRVMVEGALFGTYAPRIRYAALTLDGSGCQGYGPFALTLRDAAVKIRSTVLEENSYMFWKRHADRLTAGKAPLGYMATWHDRGRLAVAKLGKHLSPTTKASDYQGLLLRTNDDRSQEEFIEVHIYGPFDISAVDEIRVRRSMLDHPDITVIKEKLPKDTKWTEE
ncbi:MAG TPA: hypothetical protein VKY85_21440 [Candidatus Angelobacter sp.]|nr:hypothetical protein [Candidatus Angelobacter sp.]